MLAVLAAMFACGTQTMDPTGTATCGRTRLGSSMLLSTVTETTPVTSTSNATGAVPQSSSRTKALDPIGVFVPVADVPRLTFATQPAPFGVAAVTVL